MLEGKGAFLRRKEREVLGGKEKGSRKDQAKFQGVSYVAGRRKGFIEKKRNKRGKGVTRWNRGETLFKKKWGP